MKSSIIFLLMVVMLHLKISTAHGQLKNDLNYVVIGAFSVHKNAVNFTNSSKKKNLPAQFTMNPMRQLYYVYVLATPNKEEAIEEATRLRNDSAFFDTWVAFADTLVNNSTDTNVVTDDAMLMDTLANSIPPTDSTISNTANREQITELGSKKFLFKIISAKDKKEIEGDVDIMNTEKSKQKKMATYRGNEVVIVNPVNKNGKITLVSEVIGYNKVEIPLDLNHPESTPGVTTDNDIVIVPIELVPLKKGDYIMYNISFYKDAGVMRPESKEEVHNLVEVLRENPNLKIRIHGHTNGNHAGKIISMGESQNFFSISGDVKEGYGSAKKLSEERAKLIQSYLVSQGIDIQRMEIKAWGGKQPVYNVDHDLAHSNVRVEIEIIEN